MPKKFKNKGCSAEEGIFQAAFECAPAGMAIVSLQGEILKVNSSFSSLLGYPKKELVGAKVDHLLFGDRLQKDKECLHELINNEDEVCSFELKYIDSAKKEIWLMINAAVAVSDESGTPKHIVMQIEDITERKKAEAALRESEAKFRSYIEQSIDGVHVIDNEGRYIEVNTAGAAMFGYTEEELLKFKISDIIAPGESDGINHFKKLISTGESKGEITARTKCGEILTIEVNAVALGDNRYMGLVRDITARKHAEEMLLASEERFRSAFHYAPIGMALVSLEGNFLKVNGSLCEILGYSEEELLSLNFKEITHPEDLNANVDYQQRLLNGEIRNYSTQKRYINKAGHLVYTLLSATVVRDNVGKPLYFVSQIQDISEQIKAIHALIEREQMYRTLFEKAANPILVIDKEGNYLDCNEEATRFFACEREELLRQRGSVSIQPGVDIYERYKAVREKGSAIEISYVINNSLKVLELSVTPVWWRGQEAVIGIGRDITEQKEHERILRESEERYRRLVEYFPDTISIINKGKVVYINKAGVRLLEASQKESIVGRKIMDFVHPDYHDILQDRIDAAGNSSASGYLEAKFITTDNRLIDVEVTVIPFTYKGRSMVQIVIEDVTKSKQTEGALATEKQRLAITLHSIGEGVITADSDGLIVLANDVAEKLTGWKKEDMIGEYLHEVITVLQEKTGNKCLDAGTKVLQSKKQSIIPEAKILVGKDGRETIIEDIATPIFSQQGDIIGAVFVFRDISEQRKMEEEFLKVEKMESLGILAGGLAHDFNNVLTVILGNIALAKYILPKNREVAELLEETEEATVRARDLTKQLLTFAKGGAPILKTTSVIDLIRHTVSFALRGSNVKGKIDIAEDLWAVEADEGQISQVINNLIINADQAMPGGGILKVKAENISIDEDSFFPLQGNYVKITVEDNGIGIPESNLSRIFDPYFTTKQKGSGLGLATAFSVVKKHRGHIAVESQPGQGAKFYVFLPASKEKVAAKKASGMLPQTGTGRILLMDDEGAIRYTAKKILSHYGYDVTEAIDGEEAIELYKLARDSGKPYDLVITDLTVPGGMGGKETTKELLKIDPNVKVIVSSGYSTDPVMANYKDFGFIGVVAKPYKIDELTTVVKNAIG